MNQDQFVAELAKLRTSSTFLSVMGYRNEYSEVADYSIVFHISYENMLKRSIAALEAVVPSDDLESRAKRELIDGYQNSLKKLATTPIEKIDDAYTHFFDENGNAVKGIKVHTATGVLHLYGMLNAKRVLIPGQYPTSNKRELTIAKDKLRKLCPVDRFRQFKIAADRVERISGESLHLLPPDNDI